MKRASRFKALPWPWRASGPDSEIRIVSISGCGRISESRATSKLLNLSVVLFSTFALTLMLIAGELRNHEVNKKHPFGVSNVSTFEQRWDSSNMVALDGTAILGRQVPRLKLTLGPLVGGIAAGSLLLVLGAILIRGFSENGFRLGSQLAWRYGCFIFFMALVGGPLARIATRLVPRMSFPDSLGRKLVWGFCASYGIYLLSVFIPNAIKPSAGATLMVLFGGGVALIMAVTAAPLARLGRPPLIPNKIRRVLLGVCAIYFWLCYSLMALARIYGPHRPDEYYGISICLMVAGLLVRYADRWLVLKEQTITV